jgi:SAM-dependent methyltransferase
VLKPKRTIGVEFDTDAIRETHSRGIDSIRYDLNEPLPIRSESADIITVYDVLEHLVETWQFITEVYRILKPGGVVLIDSPNLAAWHNIFSLILGLQPSTGPHLISIADSDMKIVEFMHRRDHDLVDQSAEGVSASKMHRHIVVPTFRSLRRVLVRAGFHIEESRGFGYYPFPPPIAAWMCKIDIFHAHHYLIRARRPL